MTIRVEVEEAQILLPGSESEHFSLLNPNQLCEYSSRHQAVTSNAAGRAAAGGTDSSRNRKGRLREGRMTEYKRKIGQREQMHQTNKAGKRVGQMSYVLHAGVLTCWSKGKAVFVAVTDVTL